MWNDADGVGYVCFGEDVGVSGECVYIVEWVGQELIKARSVHFLNQSRKEHSRKY